MSLSLPRLRVVLPFATAVAVGLFLTIASHELGWSNSTTFVVAIAMVSLLALFGTPLMLLPISRVAQHAHYADERTTDEGSGRKR